MRNFAKATVLAALIAGAPALALAQAGTTRGGTAGNIETNPQSQPGTFNQGVGGVGNQGQVGGNPRGSSATTGTSEREMMARCNNLPGAQRDDCMRNYRAHSGNGTSNYRGSPSPSATGNTGTTTQSGSAGVGNKPPQ